MDAAHAPPPPDAGRDEFIRALIARGEAARTIDGQLPPGATHEIVDQPDGSVAVVRRRFSAG